MTPDAKGVTLPQPAEYYRFNRARELRRWADQLDTWGDRAEGLAKLWLGISVTAAILLELGGAEAFIRWGVPQGWVNAVRLADLMAIAISPLGLFAPKAFAEHRTSRYRSEAEELEAEHQARYGGEK